MGKKSEGCAKPFLHFRTQFIQSTRLLFDLSRWFDSSKCVDEYKSLSMSVCAKQVTQYVRDVEGLSSVTSKV